MQCPGYVFIHYEFLDAKGRVATDTCTMEVSILLATVFCNNRYLNLTLTLVTAYWPLLKFDTNPHSYLWVKLTDRFKKWVIYNNLSVEKWMQ